MKVLFATKNKAKYEAYKDKLEDARLDVISLKDIDIDIDVEETGETATENAIIKASTYHDKTGYITVAIDDGLVLENIPDNLQPNTHVRRINGNERATDKELIEHFSSIVTKYGENGKLDGKWVKSIAIATDKDIYHYDFETHKIFTNKPLEIMHEGYPLDSLTIDPEFNKYVIEITKEEYKLSKSKTSNDIVNFIKTSLNI